MNDPNKVISVNLSSLLSLKAELLRKQSEVSKAKSIRVSAEALTPSKYNATYKRKDTGSNNKNDEKEDKTVVYEHEDTALLQKSQKTLEAKSKFYERMAKTGGQLNSDDNFLVMFNRKKQEDDVVSSLPQRHISSSDDSSSDSDNNLQDDEDWTEYIDCLGRTRKCLRKNLEEEKKRDQDLAATMPERLDQSKPNWMIDTKGTEDFGPKPEESIFSEGCSIVSKHDEMRANWEKKSDENMQKSNIHYQDVFFDEARQHGVGYYAFSTDETERAKQQRELEETRKETLTEQEQRDKLRAQREKIIAERVRAAKNRQRARLGLPPLEVDESEKEESKESKNLETTKAERKEQKRLEKLKRKQEKLDAEKELERKHHIRPWDREKNGIPSDEKEENNDIIPEWQYKPERLPMSQQEWNEEKRAERNPEFAPPTAAATTTTHNKVRRKNFKSTEAWSVPKAVTTSTTDDFANYQSTTTLKGRQFQRRNYEIDGPEETTTRYSKGATIAPPADLYPEDNFVPPNAKKSKSGGELERSIEAGLRFLRNNSDKNTLSSKSSWTSRADY